MGRLKLVAIIAAAIIGFFAVVVLGVFLTIQISDGLGIEFSSERRSPTGLVMMAVVGVFILIGALAFGPVQSFVQSLTGAEGRRSRLAAESLRAMTRYLVASNKASECLVQADRRLTQANLGLGYQGMPEHVDAAAAWAPTKESALRDLHETSRQISARQRASLVCAAELMFMGDADCADRSGFQAVIRALEPLSRDAKLAVEKVLATPEHS
jgi:hypothetical protein